MRAHIRPRTGQFYTQRGCRDSMSCGKGPCVFERAQGGCHSIGCQPGSHPVCHSEASSAGLYGSWVCFEIEIHFSPYAARCSKVMVSSFFFFYSKYFAIVTGESCTTVTHGISEHVHQFICISRHFPLPVLSSSGHLAV